MHHHHYAETQNESPGAAGVVVVTDDDFREPTMTFDLSEVSTAYEPAYEPVDYESLPQTTSLSPLAKKGAVASFQSSSSSSSSYQEHRRQQSAPVFSLPRINSSRSPSLSPTRCAPPPNKRLSQQDMPLTGDGRAGIGRPQNAPTTGRFANWFNGSASVASAAADERLSPNTTPKSARGGGVGGGPTTPNETMATTPKSAGGQSRFGGFFASSVFGTRPANNQQNPTNAQQQQLDDELCDLDIEAALYPGGTALLSSSSSPTTTTEQRDAFSPAAYKNLQTNAAGLLLKMQGAYRERTVALREARAEREAQREEMEETRLRVALVKAQLEDMAQKAAEHEAAMQRLVTELSAEKRARYEDRMAREREKEREKERERGSSKSIMNSPPLSSSSIDAPPSEDLGVDEDAEEERRRRWRGSRGTVESGLSVETMTTDGGSAIGSGDSASAASTSAPESESVSVFSRSRSPTVMTSITTAESTVGSSGGGESPAPSVILPFPPSSSSSSHSKAAAAALAPPKPKQVQQLSTFQRFVKGISTGNEQAENSGPDNCRNCRGQTSSVAWDTVSLLRDENKGLKHRVAQLEVAVEGALDAVNGIGL